MKVFCEEDVLNQDYLLLHQKSHKNNIRDHVIILCFKVHKKPLLFVFPTIDCIRSL